MEALRADSGVIGAYTSVLRIEPDGTVRDILETEFDRDLLRNEAYVDMNSLMIRRSKGIRFSRLPRNGQRPPAEDWELVWRLSRTGDLRHLDRTTVRYSLNVNSYFADWYHEKPDP